MIRRPVEIEFKYNADNITLANFLNFCKDRGPSKLIVAAGWDHFYEKSNDDSSFCRHRIGPDANQLTFKRKTTDSNNFVRTERNLDLGRTATKEDIDGLCAEFGYKYNTSLYKNCFVHKFEWYTAVFYICYDTNMKELGRFVEIEMDEDHAWSSEQEAWDELVVLEKLFKPLGLSAQSRIKRSLFELFKK